MKSALKPMVFLGSSQDDMRKFPASVRHEVGLELMRIQFWFDAHQLQAHARGWQRGV